MTNSFVQIGDALLLHGDALKVLGELRGNLVVTDPPYELESGGNSTGEMQGKFAKDRYDNSGKIVECDIDWPDFMPLIYNCLVGDAHTYVMCNNRHVGNMLNAAESAGFRFHNLLVWEKGNATPNRWYMKNCEFVGFFFKGKAKYVADCGAQQLIHVPQEPYGDHPTPKPTMLMQHYIEQSSHRGDTVIDPFMGVGSTGIAALRAGRKFVGIEKDLKHFSNACARIDDFIKRGQIQLL